MILTASRLTLLKARVTSTDQGFNLCPVDMKMMNILIGLVSSKQEINNEQTQMTL
jgi:hypothetical protein